MTIIQKFKLRRSDTYNPDCVSKREFNYNITGLQNTLKDNHIFLDTSETKNGYVLRNEQLEISIEYYHRNTPTAPEKIGGSHFHEHGIDFCIVSKEDNKEKIANIEDMLRNFYKDKISDPLKLHIREILKEKFKNAR